jgi:hypothetical protein
VEWYRQRKTRDSPTWQSSKQSYSSNAGRTGEENDEFGLRNIFNISKSSLACRKILRYGADGLTSPQKGVLQIIIVLKNPSPSAVSEPVNLGANGNHANH